ncbi:hypothetical protein [Catenuloplanes indicus]|uniref:Uncharacterized protein n=1 Tax=Catenuloplanes indicus TaxID=137267 RepID=A0AAE4B2E7_9ACTN|nr:hypothetical protein [Catenuloplanes indicus]MDQ0371582.1 hypothetical protein [Catenuloplanes indicus]
MTTAVLTRPAAPTAPPGGTGTLVCTAGCGYPLDPAAAAGGFTTHPACDLPDDIPQATRWQCGRLVCPANGPAKGDHDAIDRIRMHDHVHHKPTRRGRRR